MITNLFSSNHIKENSLAVFTTVKNHSMFFFRELIASIVGNIIFSFIRDALKNLMRAWDFYSIKKEEVSVSLDDAIITDEKKEELKRLAYNIKANEYVRSFARGMCIYGKSCIGKQHLAKCIAGSLERPVYKLGVKDVVFLDADNENFVNVLEKAKEEECVIIIENIDAFGCRPSRGRVGRNNATSDILIDKKIDTAVSELYEEKGKCSNLLAIRVGEDAIYKLDRTESENQDHYMEKQSQTNEQSSSQKKIAEMLAILDGEKSSKYKKVFFIMISQDIQVVDPAMRRGGRSFVDIDMNREFAKSITKIFDSLLNKYKDLFSDKYDLNCVKNFLITKEEFQTSGYRTIESFLLFCKNALNGGKIDDKESIEKLIDECFH